ncbi:hypothetical protein MASR2M78_22150 [Treponema sp.]
MFVELNTTSDPAGHVDVSLRLKLIEKIAASTINTEQLESIRSVFVRGQSFALGPDQIARIVIAELSAGGTLRSIDAELNRMRRNR